MLTESMEDYLEIIYRLSESKGYVKAVDIAEDPQRPGIKCNTHDPKAR